MNLATKTQYRIPSDAVLPITIRTSERLNVRDARQKQQASYCAIMAEEPKLTVTSDSAAVKVEAEAVPDAGGEP